ncbi:UNVERIFIED_CONTAM: hypothetical protein HDU68_011390 [Siphonaria sp. JEL0065]|nr:hypothetical protein HDU68_011390 [Siphonaria sp. JEL0065]
MNTLSHSVFMQLPHSDFKPVPLTLSQLLANANAAAANMMVPFTPHQSSDIQHTITPDPDPDHVPALANTRSTTPNSIAPTAELETAALPLFEKGVPFARWSRDLETVDLSELPDQVLRNKRNRKKLGFRKCLDLVYLTGHRGCKPRVPEPPVVSKEFVPPGQLNISKFDVLAANALGISIEITSEMHGTLHAQLIQQIDNSGEEPLVYHNLLLVNGTKDLQFALFQWFLIGFNGTFVELEIPQQKMEGLFKALVLGIDTSAKPHLSLVLGEVTKKGEGAGKEFQIVLNSQQIKEAQKISRMFQLPPVLSGITNNYFKPTQWITTLCKLPTSPLDHYIQIIKTDDVVISKNGSVLFADGIPVKTLIMLLSYISNL